MKTIAIVLPEKPDATRRLKQHLFDKGLKDVYYMPGIAGEEFGLSTRHTYEYDNPGTDYHIGNNQVGLCLSHYMAWAIIDGTNETRIVLESDALFVDDWKDRLDSCLGRAIVVMPDWEMMYIGSCHAKKVRYQLDRDLWEVKWPMCTHGYVLTPAGARKLLASQREIYAHIDCALMQRSLPDMKVLTVLPRIVDQFHWNDTSAEALYNG